MKSILFAGLLLVANSAFGVSIEFPTYTADSISEVVTSTEDGNSTMTRIEFSGKDLKPLMTVLPKVRDMDHHGAIVPNQRRFSVTNLGQQGITPDKATEIHVVCNSDKAEAKCYIEIFKGNPPG